ADVNYKVVKEFINKTKEKAVGEEVIKSITPGQLMVKIVHDELIELLGGKAVNIKEAGIPPTIIMLSGLQGSGKTTFSGKLARLYKKKGRFPMVVGADVYRPAARKQLEVLAKSLDVPFYSEEHKDAVKIAHNAVTEARQKGCDLLIIDTAGRLHIDEEMMKELENLKKKLDPHEILFVADGMTGQDAVNAAKKFQESLDFDGVVLTKLDGDSRGGAALSIKAVTGKPIKFLSIGEKLEDIEQFYPERLVSRILGMGDIVSLVEKAHEHIDEEKARKLEKKLRKADFDMSDFLDQLNQIKKMGSLKDILGMIPGVGKQLKNQQIDESITVRMEAIINSMTLKERAKPKIINGSRRKRIAKGSGTEVQDVNKMLKQFNEMKKMLKKMKNMNPKAMMRSGKMPFGF
ncbi:MAG: signal recognition particle protein, partial [Calditrichia bacterium]|nr:signal recognition particle protein [Calditrichia bacterium]